MIERFVQEASFFFASVKASSSSSPGIDREAGLDRLTRIGGSQAELLSAWEITRRSIPS